ncbi:MAG: hypothetical protein PUA63_02970 [Oscillospiraceae bacterium]|nr:hypothetical protein [Oscillospiraceae bacterium]
MTKRVPRKDFPFRQSIMPCGLPERGIFVFPRKKVVNETYRGIGGITNRILLFHGANVENPVETVENLAGFPQLTRKSCFFL